MNPWQMSGGGGMYPQGQFLNPNMLVQQQQPQRPQAQQAHPSLPSRQLQQPLQPPLPLLQQQRTQPPSPKQHTLSIPPLSVAPLTKSPIPQNRQLQQQSAPPQPPLQRPIPQRPLLNQQLHQPPSQRPRPLVVVPTPFKPPPPPAPSAPPTTSAHSAPPAPPPPPVPSQRPAPPASQHVPHQRRKSEPPPVQLPELEPYLVLWTLAEQYVTEAQKLPVPALRLKDEQLLQKYHSLVLCAIKCLRAVFKIEKVPVKVEMQTRLRLAEILTMETENYDMAETLLSKGILRMPKNPEFNDLKFAMQHLQASILARTSPKACRAHLKTCLDEATDRGLLIWQYSFLLTRLQQPLLAEDTHEISQYTNLLHLLRNLAQQNGDHDLIELSYLLEIRHALQFHIPSVNIDDLLSLAEQISHTNPFRQKEHLQLSLMRILLHILHLTRLDKTAHAIAKLREHHQFMDTVIPEGNMQGTFELVVMQGTQKLRFQWFEQGESFVYGYLLSGIVNFSDSTNAKAWNFLVEGNRVVDTVIISETYDTNSWLSEASLRLNRLNRLKRYCLLYASFTALLRSKFRTAINYIDVLHTLNRDYFPPPSSDDAVFTHLLHLLVGIQNHWAGHFDAAMQFYLQIPPEAGETYLLSLLNRAVILRGSHEPQEVAQATKLLDEMERRIAARGGTSPQLLSAFLLLRGITASEVLKSKYPPTVRLTDISELLSKAAHIANESLNNQIRMIALAGAGVRFTINFNPEQAEKIGLMTYVTAKKSDDHLWALVGGNLLAGILSPIERLIREDSFRRQDKPAKKEKQELLNEESRHKVRERFESQW